MATGGLYGNSGTGALIAQPGTESSGLYGKSPNGSVVAQPGSESAGLYGNGTTFGGSYFEWFVFQTSATQPATPTGGSWSFQTNSGTPPSGWTNAPASNPTNPVWISIALVNSKSTSSLVWSTPGVLSYSGTINGSGAPTSGVGQIGELYIQTGVTPNALWFKTNSTTWTQITGSALYVDLVSSQTIAGTKTFSSTIQGSISGNAGTVTNGVYTDGTYVNPSWIASLAGSKITGDISGNAANVTGTVAVTNGGTGATTAGGARTNLGLGTISTQDASSVAITGGSITGITDLAIADGGTGASTAGQARINLGLGTSAVLDAGVANGVATLDSGGTVPLSQIPASIQGGVSYQGAWNASTNSPTLTSSVGTKGYYYVVSVAGSTNLNGVTDWNVGDWAIFNGTVWQKIDNTDAVTSVNGYTGTVVLNAADVGALSTLTSTDGSVTITSPNSVTRDLSVAISGSTTNVLCLVRNTTGATLTKGTVVYISGATGQNPTVSKALATSDATSAQTLGMMTADLANNTNGYVTVIGLITNIDTSAYTDGAQLYLSGTTAGTVTATKPYAPIHLVYVAVVEYAHPTQGKLFVKVQNGYELDEIHDVSIVSPTTGQTLVYNATTDLWENSNAPVISGTTIDNTTIGATTPSTGVFTTLTANTSVTTPIVGAATGSSTTGLDLNVNSKAQARIVEIGDGTRPLVINGGSAGGAQTAGITATTVLAISGGGGNPIRFYTNGRVTTQQLEVAHTASAVNYVQVTGAATGGTPTISAQGSDANTNLQFNAKGYGSVLFASGPSNRRMFEAVYGTGSDANWMRVAGAASSSSPVLSAQGSDTNIDLNLTPKGTGTVVANGPFTATGQTSLGGAAGAEGLRVVPFVSQTSRLEVTGGLNGGKVQAYVAGTGNTELWISSLGTGAVRFQTNSGATEQLRVTNTASAVNYVQVTGAATGAAPSVISAGSDSSSNLAFSSKGTGSLYFYSNSANANSRHLDITHNGSVVNRFQLTGANAGSGVVLGVNGGDTNISQVFQSKGTGAIDLAAGSSGVNISNGGTVTAITRTAAGTFYTSIPTLTISPPTTAGGVQATATPQMAGQTVTVQAAGTGYVVGNTLTVVGGTSSATAQLRVDAINGSGGVTATSFVNSAGAYSVLPTNPVSVTGGAGSGATFNITQWFFASVGPIITNAGSGYVEQPTVSFSGGGGSGAAAYATVGSIARLTSIGGGFELATPNGVGFRVANSGTTNVNYLSAQGNAAGGPVNLIATGTDTDITTSISSKGTGSVRFLTNGASQEQLRVSHTASAVNYVQVTGAATGSPPAITVQGSDANVRMNISSKGTESVDILTNNTGTRAARFTYTASSVNWAQMTGSATGFGVVFSAQGSDTNIPVVIQPKGTGALQAQQTDSTATGGNARGANAVDWQTIRSGASQVAAGQYGVVSGGISNTVNSVGGVIGGGSGNFVSSSGYVGGIFSGLSNQSNGFYSPVVGGASNQANGYYNFVGGGFTNTGTANAAVTTQSATMNGTTAVTLAASNASIKVGQYISGTSIANDTYVAAVSGTSLTLSKVASGSSTSTLSFYTPHGVVVGGGNNQATGAYSFIGGGGDAGTASQRNVASGDWSFVGGGKGNGASGIGSVICGGGVGANNLVFPNVSTGYSSFVGGGIGHTSSNTYSAVLGGSFNAASGIAGVVVAGRYATDRGISGNTVLNSGYNPIGNLGTSQSSILTLGRQTTDATATVLTSDTSAASTVNQVILPNNSAYYFRGEVVSGVTGGGNTKGWYIEGVIKRGANAASTALVGTPTVTSNYADAGASTWTIAVTADTTNGGLAVTFTGQAATTIRTVAQIRTTEMTY